MKKCGNCKYRCFSSWSGIDNCLDYEMACTEEEEIKAAADCKRYEKGTPECLEDRHRNDRDEWDDLWADRARSVGAVSFYLR